MVGARMIMLWPNGSNTRPTITSPFGPREAPVLGASKYHRGTDFVGYSTVRAIADGAVVAVGTPGGWGAGGTQVWVQHDGFLTRSMHLVAGSPVVRVKQLVRAGDPLGTMGRTGNVSGVHHHLEVVVHGIQVDPVAFITNRLVAVAEGAASTSKTPTTPTRKRRKNTMIHAAWRDANGSFAVQCRPGGKVTWITEFYDWAGMSAGSGAEAAQITNEQMQALHARYGSLSYPKFDTGRENVPPLVYVPKGNGTIYTLVEGRLRPLTDMATVNQLLDLGAPSLTLSIGERDNLLKS